MAHAAGVTLTQCSSATGPDSKPSAPLPIGTILLTASYPPRGGSGVQRVYYQSENLAASGMVMHVVTEADESRWVRDTTMQAVNVAAERIHRLPQDPFSGPSWLLRPLRRLFRLVAYPDDHCFWATQAYRRIADLIERGGIGCVMASLGRPSVLVTLLLLKRRFPGLPVVVDVRDLWVGNEIKLTTRRTRWGLGWLNCWLERAVFRQAAAIVTVSKGLAEAIEERYRAVGVERVHVVENGYVDDVFPAVATTERDDGPIIFRHTGFLVKDQKVERFMQALSIAKSRDSKTLQDCRVEFVGGNPDLPRELAVSHGVEDLVNCSGYVSHEKSVSLMMTADVLLLFWAPGIGTVGGKLYEYVRANQFILAFDQGNRDGKEILNRTERGRSVPIDDVEQQAKVLTELIEARRNGESLLPSTLPSIDEYSRRSQNDRLFEVLNAVIHENA
jgi:glycosyltransferase involved in cell wall biosynthesis